MLCCQFVSPAALCALVLSVQTLVMYTPFYLAYVPELKITYLCSLFIVCVLCRFVNSLRLYVSHIVGYRRLIVEVEAKRRTLYSSDNEEHEALLMQV